MVHPSEVEIEVHCAAYWQAEAEAEQGRHIETLCQLLALKERHRKAVRRQRSMAMVIGGLVVAVVGALLR